MATPQQIEAAIKKVQDQTSFIKLLLKETLNWQIPDGVENIEDMSYIWTSDDLRVEGLDGKVVEGKVLQIQPMQQNQPWGIFLLEFKNADTFIKGRGLTGPLRKVLRGLVRKKRQQANRPAWDRENLLFICTHNYRHYRFAYFKAPPEKEKTAPLAMFGWNQHDSEIRTLCQHNLPFLEWDEQSNWQQAFSIEKVTKEFYKAYAAVFDAAEDYIAKANKGLKDDKLRLFTQMLFNRLMFLRFVEKKGWLKFGNGRDYLKDLFAAKGLKGKSFYESRLCPLFFEGLAIEKPNCREAVGDVPFLNGGLFEMTDIDNDVSDIPDEAFKGIIGDDGLFYHFNFTVEESTPLDIEVAVDPEMLGKVFEELVTGRHESGSYYTPRPIVSFMCKEALKGFLCGKTSASKEAIEKLVDDHEVAQGLTDFHAEEILYYLDTIKACDPACGSGAYLLGLLQELIAIRRTLQNERLLADAAFMYKLKLGIISRSLYGVDIDEFATNVAKLRLWLSLAVEAEKPQPLPNLDFKIETGDSVLGPCTPFLETEEALTMSALRERAKQLVAKKTRFMTAHGNEKRGLFDEIRKEEATIATETATVYGDKVIAWHIHFAEAFVSGRRQQQIDRNIADIGDFKVTTIEPGGFDIVLVNPPYIRQELIKDIKPRLKEVFPQTFAGTADLYTYFYTRAVEMLGPGGVLAFISSNKFFRAGYGAKLREFLARELTLYRLIDFGDAPVFEAIAYASILAGVRAKPAHDASVLAYTWEKEIEFDRISQIVPERGQQIRQSELKADGWRLESPAVMRLLEKLRRAGKPLGEYVNRRFYYGIKTGLGEAFVVDLITRDRLIHEHKSSAEILKPFLRGRDVKRWQTEFAEQYLIKIESSENKDHPWSGKSEKEAEKIFNKTYPSIYEYFQSLRDIKLAEPDARGCRNMLEKVQHRDDQGKYFWELRSCIYWEEFEQTKIILGRFMNKATFAFDKDHYYHNDALYMIAGANEFVVAILNSSVSWWFLTQICTDLQNGYLQAFRENLFQIPIPSMPTEQQKPLERLVERILTAKQHNAEADVSELEREIDEMVYAIYGLTAEEIAIIEGKI